MAEDPTDIGQKKLDQLKQRLMAGKSPVARKGGPRVTFEPIADAPQPRSILKRKGEVALKQEDAAEISSASESVKPVKSKKKASVGAVLAAAASREQRQPGLAVHPTSMAAPLVNSMSLGAGNALVSTGDKKKKKRKKKKKKKGSSDSSSGSSSGSSTSSELLPPLQ